LKEIMGEWSNLSMQSILPSRQFSRKSRIPPLKYGMRNFIDHDISYHGGSSLSISGKSTTVHTIQSATNIVNAFPLFQTSFPVDLPMILEVIYLPSKSETIDVILCCQNSSKEMSMTVLPIIAHKTLNEVPKIGH